MDNKFLNHLKENKYFYILLSLLIIFIAFFITDLVITINFPFLFEFPEVKSVSKRLEIYYAYFTTQTNYIVIIYLFISLILEKTKKYFKINFPLLLAVTVYITITMLVFWTGIIGNFIKVGFSAYWHKPYSWIKTIILHLIVPITMITTYILVSGWELVIFKKYVKMYFWITLIYPILYFIAVMIRGDLEYNSGNSSATSYPYFFLNYHEYGFLALIIAVLIIMGLLITLQYFYIWINNKHYELETPSLSRVRKQICA